MDQPRLALRITVGTYVGMRDGVPALLAILDRFGIRATFYLSLGPDNSGKAIRRIFLVPELVKKLLQTRPLSRYGLKTLLYGTLLPAPVIGQKLPQVIRSIDAAGHELGIHGWDQVKWHDLLPWFPKPVTAMELGKAGAAFEALLGRRARTTAAPGWIVSADSLEVQDAMGLDYCSDTRGTSPFYPVVNGRSFNTLQIPTTWPTRDELLGEEGIADVAVNDHLCRHLHPGLNVHTIRAELEGLTMQSHLTELLTHLTAREVRFITLAEAASAAEQWTPPDCELITGKVPGRAAGVALQGARL
jgi:peptidoglycan/xylan/chitin deacetylase (PgdA/CDA1 family)